MIEWKEAQAGSGRWTADIGGETALFVWPFKGEYCFDFSLARGVDIIRDAGYPTLDAAKLAAETFAREWVARQAAALGGGWISVEERLPESDGWYHVAVHDYKGRYPRHELAEFTHGRFWIPGDNGEGDSVFAWRGPALPPLPVGEVEE